MEQTVERYEVIQSYFVRNVTKDEPAVDYREKRMMDWKKRKKFFSRDQKGMKILIQVKEPTRSRKDSGIKEVIADKLAEKSIDYLELALEYGKAQQVNRTKGAVIHKNSCYYKVNRIIQEAFYESYPKEYGRISWIPHYYNQCASITIIVEPKQ